MSASFILRGGRVIDPANGIDEIRDVYIREGILVDSAAGIDGPVVDVGGLVVCPGFIDLHVHLREPGQEYKEDIRTGTAAAAAGGFTSVVAMPNTVPPIDNPEVLEDLWQRLREKALVRVLPCATLSEGRRGERPSEAAALAAAGAVALTDDGSCIQSAAVMRAAMFGARQAGLPVIDHCEDEGVALHGAMNAGETAARLGVQGQPGVAEELMVGRDCLLAAEVEWPVHIQHISTARSIEIIRAARKLGVPVSGEVTPHHLCLTEKACEVHGALAKMNPPLRTEADRRALLEALADGTVQCIATDHAPHTLAEKGVGLEKAPSGVVGLETAVPLCLETLVHGGVLTLPRFVACFTVGPRRILGLRAGTLSCGEKADITLLDIDTPHVLHVSEFRSRSRNCPYDGMSCRGRVMGTILGGEWVFSRLSGSVL